MLMTGPLMAAKKTECRNTKHFWELHSQVKKNAQALMVKLTTDVVVNGKVFRPGNIIYIGPNYQGQVVITRWAKG